MLDLGDIDIMRTALLLGVIIIGVGTVLGTTGKIVVFRDFSDLFLTFSYVAGWAAAAYLAALLLADRPSGEQRVGTIALIAVLFALLCSVFRRAYADNGAVWRTVLSVLTKLPYAVLVPLLAIQALSPRGDTAAKRASARAWALLLLTILAPLLVALTRDKSSFEKVRGLRVY